MMQEQKIVKNKIGLLKLAQTLGSVSEACKVLGFSRDSFYRFKELYEKNPNITIDEVKTNLEMRDYIDSNREFSPLRKAKDAIELNNSRLTAKEQLKMALKLAKDKINELSTVEAG